MLSKLLKYEIKATGRTLLPLYLALVVCAALNKLITTLSQDGESTPAVISMILYITILVGVMAMTVIIMIQRFYKNLLSDEGYLMFTIPTKPWKHITSKLLVSMMWMVASCIVALVSIFIIAFDQDLFQSISQGLSEAFDELYQVFGASAYALIFEMILAAFVGLVSGIIMIYASISIGHLFSKHRILASLGAYVVLSIISQILFVIMGFIPGFIHINGAYPGINTPEFIQYISQLVIWWGILFSGIISAAYFFITNHILSKRLNLE